MEKLDKHCKLGKSYNTDYKEFDRIFKKVNEMVAWINEHEQARGEHDPK